MSEPADVEAEVESNGAARLLARLRDASAADRLVDRWVADLLGRPVADLIPPTQVAELAARLLAGAAASDAFGRGVEKQVDEGLASAELDRSRLQDRLPPELVTALRELAARPHSPDRRLVLAVLDREPVRKLIRALLVDVLVEFGRRIAAVASPLTGSRVGRGLGAFAAAVGSGVVGAISSELERQVEKRAAEFADLGISRVLHRLADLASDPSHAQEQAELRSALLEGFLELRRSDLARDVRRQKPNAVVRLIREAVRGYWARPESRATLESDLRRILGDASHRPLGAALDELGLRADIESALKEYLLPRARAFDWASWIEHELIGSMD
jgi:hypothetical protein